jgi:hypothetical protein
MNPELPYSIDYKNNWFLKTLVTAEGLVIAAWLRQPVTIPWDKIECLDLSGLKAKDAAWLSNKLIPSLIRHVNATRFFLIMSSDHALLRRCRGGRKIWHPGINVLGLTEIMPTCADILLPLLNKIAAEKNIKQDLIVLEG